MAEEKTVNERLSVVENQLEVVGDALIKLEKSMDRLAQMFSEFMSKAITLETRVTAHDQELSHGRDHMTKTDEKVDRIQQRCDQTESLRIAGQRHLDEAPNVIEKTNRAWISSDLSTKIMLGMMGTILALLLYLATGGKIGG